MNFNDRLIFYLKIANHTRTSEMYSYWPDTLRYVLLTKSFFHSRLNNYYRWIYGDRVKNSELQSTSRDLLISQRIPNRIMHIYRMCLIRWKRRTSSDYNTASQHLQCSIYVVYNLKNFRQVFYTHIKTLSRIFKHFIQFHI